VLPLLLDRGLQWRLRFGGVVADAEFEPEVLRVLRDYGVWAVVVLIISRDETALFTHARIAENC
jgi:hypothetical protein